MKHERLKLSVEHHFTELLNTHMSTSPVLNRSLEIEAVGLCNWENHHLCVVITPWIMSLFLTPVKGDNSLQSGSVRNRQFANGSFTFTAAKDDLIGNYETCTLFTSMSDFTSQSQARDVALETIRLLLGEEKPTTNNPAAETLKAPNKRDFFLSAVRRSKKT